MPEPIPEGYDEVLVPSETGAKTTMTRRQFEALPLRNRVQLIMENKLEFRLKGSAVASKVALKS